MEKKSDLAESVGRGKNDIMNGGWSLFAGGRFSWMKRI